MRGFSSFLSKLQLQFFGYLNVLIRVGYPIFVPYIQLQISYMQVSHQVVKGNKKRQGTFVFYVFIHLIIFYFCLFLNIILTRILESVYDF